MTLRKARIAQAFTAQAEAYDEAAALQRLAACRLAERIRKSVAEPPGRILEIGCGTGFLSAQLAELFPASRLLLTDISAAMLDLCKSSTAGRHCYQVLDGEWPGAMTGRFDLIVSSLAFQWFSDLPGGLERLSRLLAPGGRLMFATLGRQTFTEWRRAHADLGLACGTQDYPAMEDFSWPDGFSHAISDELILRHHADGVAFVRGLKMLGAREPAPGYRPLSPGAFRRLLATLENSFSVTYHILYGEIF